VVFQVQPLRDLRPAGRALADTVGSPQPSGASGVRVARVIESQTPFRQVYQPGHPQADANGMVAYPNVDPVEEMTNMIAASRAYQFNVEVMNTSRILIQRTLEIGR
jgi:flagellar basal-body rod protein FlgC